jgi:flavodoxin
MQGLIVYSSRTGNTEKVAKGIYEAFLQESELFPIEKAPDPEGYQWILLGFWVNRGTADDDTLAYINRLHNKHVGFFATLGAYPDSKHAADVAERVGALISKDNALLGCFLCQGKIDPKLTEKFKQFPPDHPHAMTPERIQRHKDALSHPDAEDVANATRACKSMLSANGFC